MNDASELPLEKIEEILLSVEPKNIVSVCQTNKKFNQVCNNPRFWKKYYHRWVTDDSLYVTGDWKRDLFRNYRYYYDLDEIENYWVYNGKNYLNISKYENQIKLIPIKFEKDRVIYYPYGGELTFNLVDDEVLIVDKLVPIRVTEKQIRSRDRSRILVYTIKY